jgi:2-succinyl-6-hydroxy-2,4-cyclohexadiene-1-carboxylate synthase
MRSRDGVATLRRALHRVMVGDGYMSACEYAPVRPRPKRQHRPSRAALVFLHGFTGSYEVWEPIVVRWARELGARRAGDFGRRDHDLSDLRLVAIDLPGHGASRFTSEGGYAMEAAAAAIDATLDALGIDSCVLVGYSLGGRLALYFSLTRPARVTALVMESASAGLATDHERAARRRDDQKLIDMLEQEGLGAFVEYWERLPLFASQAAAGDRARSEQRAIRLSCGADGLAASLRGMGTGSQPWLGDRLGEIRVPVLLVTGSDDDKFTRLAATMASRIDNVRHEVVGSAGHDVHLEQPEAFVALLGEFLGSALSAVRPGRPAAVPPSGGAARGGRDDADGSVGEPTGESGDESGDESGGDR